MKKSQQLDKPLTGTGRPMRPPAKARRVLLAWEMGEGLGHASRLLTLARLFRQERWLPVVAARNPAALAERYAAEGITVISSPPHRNCFRGPGRFRARSFADVMGVCGYADPLQLEHMVRAWDAVLQEHAPHLVITDYSPLLSLAAFGRFPVVAVGDGFVTPPASSDGNFPAMDTEVPDVWDPAQLLENARWVQQKHGRPVPSSLSAIITGIGQITSVPRELDIHAAERQAPAAGPWAVAAAPQPLPAQAQVFAYLRMDHPPARQLLQALVDCRVAGECFLHGVTPEVEAMLEGSALKRHAQAPSLPEVLGRTSWLLHHGGMGTLEEALIAGRSQLLLPRHLEQQLNARRAVGANSGIFALSPNASAQQLCQRLPALLESTEPLAAAQAVAARVTQRPESAWQVMQRLLSEAGLVPAMDTTVRATVETAYARANQLHRQGDLAAARSMYEDILQRDPRHVGTRVDLANARRDQGDLAGAEADLRFALASHPGDPKILQSLGHLLRITGRLDEAVGYLRRALGFAASPALHWQLAYTLLLMGRYREAWPHFEHRHAALKLRTAHPAKPRWDGRTVDFTLLVLDEQGLGDTLQFLRFLQQIPRTEGGRVIFAGKPAVLPLVRCLLPAADVVSWNEAPLPPSQCWVPLMSLPRCLGINTPAELPPPASPQWQLVDEERCVKWRQRVRDPDGKKPVLALCWQGNHDFSGDRWRSPGLASLLPVLETEGFRFVSLQVGSGRQAIRELNLQETIIDLGADIEAEGVQVLDTLAALANCDFVISSCTSVAHMAGLMGVPGCVLLSTRPDWRWMMHCADSPWYPSLTLIRQKTQGDWYPVACEAAQQLQQWRDARL